MKPADSAPPPPPLRLHTLVQFYALDTSTGAVKGQLQMYPEATGQTVHPQAASMTIDGEGTIYLANTRVTDYRLYPMVGPSVGVSAFCH